MKIKNLLTHPLFSGSFIMFGGAMIINIVNYIYHLLMGRILGPVDYGTLASLYSILYIVSIVPLSSSIAIVKYISSAKTEIERISIYNKINNFIIYLALILGLILMIFSPQIANFLNISNFWNVTIIGPILFFSLITLVNQSFLQGILNFVGYTVPNLVSGVGKLIFGVLLIFGGWSVFGAMVGVLIGLFLTYLSSLLFIRKVIKLKTKKDFNLLPFLKYSLPVLFQALAFTSFFTIDVILVKHFFPPFEAGLYAALSTLGKVIYFATSSITGTMFPIVAGRHARGQSYFKVLISALGAITAASLGLIVIYWLFPEMIIKLLYGTKYLEAKNFLVWMGMFLGIYSLNYFLINFFLSVGKIKIVIIPIIFALIQALMLWFFHNDLLIIIKINLIIMLLLFLFLLPFLGYNCKQCQEKNFLNNFFQ